MTLNMMKLSIKGCVLLIRRTVTVSENIIMTRKRICEYRKMYSTLSRETMAEKTIENQQHLENDEIDRNLLSSDSEEEVLVPKKHKFLVVGLGNPEVQRTRHSVGMMFVNRLASQLGIMLTKEVFKKTGGYSGSIQIKEDIELHLLKPRVPMNINGTSVIKSVRHHSVNPENVYIVHDELDKPVGVANIKEGGSARGHNGVRSVMDSLKSDVMPRLRIGIDRPANKDDVAEYVLTNFPLEEYQVICGVIDSAIKDLLEHIGKKCDTVLDVDLIKVPESSYSEEEQLKFRFGQKSGKGHWKKDDDRRGGFNNSRRNMADRRPNKFHHVSEFDSQFREENRYSKKDRRHPDIFSD